jgi:uncharacterized protein YlxW (UPF0749 family)
MTKLKDEQGKYISWRRMGGILIGILMLILTASLADTSAWKKSVNSDIKALWRVKQNKADYEKDRVELRAEINTVQMKLDTLNTNVLLLIGRDEGRNR